MHASIEQARGRIAELCRRHEVARLVLFGSATGPRFDPNSSDVDLLVDFRPLPPVQHADAYFGLMEELQRLLGRPVDLVERAPITNPYLLQAIEESQVVLYAAA